MVQECAVTEGLHACVSLGSGAKGDLRDCVLSSSGLDGVAAYGSSTEVDASNCKMVCATLASYSSFHISQFCTKVLMKRECERLFHE